MNFKSTVILLLFTGILDAWDLTLWIIGNQAMAHEPATDAAKHAVE